CRIGSENELVDLIPQPKVLRSPILKCARGGLAGRPCGMERRRERNPWSALEIRRHLLLELGEGGGSAPLLALDEERWCGLDVQLCRGALAPLFDAVENLLVLQALVELRLTEASLLADRHQGLQRPLHRPGALLLEQGLDHREIALLAAAARQHEGGGCELVE